jgi:hypothetical protein
MTNKKGSDTTARDSSKLNSNSVDWATVVAKGSAGAIPIAGGFLAEIVGSLIPNQRMDRIVEFLTALDNEFKRLPEDVVEKLRDNELFIDLVEESCIKASRAVSNERREYILNIIKNGISDNDASINNAKYLLGLLSELNDSEVIWLNYFYFCKQPISKREAFQKLHSNILAPVSRVLGSDKATIRQGAIQDSYKEHLERLGLIKHNIKINKDSNVPEYDRFSNKPKIYNSETTTLGDALLENIGLINWRLPFAKAQQLSGD